MIATLAKEKISIAPRAPRALMAKAAKILVIDNNSSITRALEDTLSKENYEVMVSTDALESLEMAKTLDFDAVITALCMPGIHGLDLIQTLHHLKPKLPIILITVLGSTETAIRTTQLGAYDYLLKPYEISDLLDALQKAVTSYRMASVPIKLGDEEAHHQAFIGKSHAMQTVYKDIGRFANKPVTVLIRGESGSGKELVARALYQFSDRAKKPFIAVNCAAIPKGHLESELFGHEKGAFTGAGQKRIGRFEQANGGTLFLDEIGELNLKTQVKLLHVLQEKTIQRIGSKQTVPVDVRVIAATHVDLEKAIREKTFRKDLFRYLNGVIIELPSLHNRAEDISLLAKYFIRRYTYELCLQTTGIKPNALRFLEKQCWPGNVRQMGYVMRKALLECEGHTITIEALENILDNNSSRLNVSADNPHSLDDLDGLVHQMLTEAKLSNCESVLQPLTDMLELSLYHQAIDMTGGNQAKAARWIGVSRLTMREKLQKFNLHPKDRRGTDL